MNKQKSLAALRNLAVPGFGTAYGGNIGKATLLYVLYLGLVVAWLNGSSAKH